MSSATASVITDLLHAGKTVRLRVTGKSMAPSVMSGDTVWLESVAPAQIAKEMIVLSCSAKGTVLHRVASVDHATGCVQTRGDALAVDDPPVATKDIAARVVRVERRVLPRVTSSLRAVTRLVVPHRIRATARAVLDGRERY